ncbi:enhanced serine sensitivity protein SseB [Colwellia sp. Arc7-D]|uniref:enhanced serine sensitivity protein SseB n=1 Tax=Colwellia sp. Arc7-D TaxID=2161872 RepID=UPI000D3D5AB4|nr:enhanced serine sensitivity protein SseB [Colwellia sp. Arc7-D]AWB58280.1 enhanced serine sensitivity protein SseB [Colwellia sp. Arc7-D]
MDIDGENKLEALLRLAADEPAHRPEFCSVLLQSTIFVLGDTGEQPTELDEIDLLAGSKINIQNWEKQDGDPVIPFFSSLDVLSKALDSEQSYIELPVRSLFEMTMGSNLFLNPKSDYGKEFIPQEIEQLLNNGISQVPSQRVVEKETKVLLGQPSNYPTKMVDSLTQLLVKHKEVKKAYVALMHDRSIDEKPHLLVGIEGDGDLELAMREVGHVAGDTAPAGEAVDLFIVRPDEAGVSQYLINLAPFYERTWGKKLRSFFGVGKA